MAACNLQSNAKRKANVSAWRLLDATSTTGEGICGCRPFIGRKHLHKGENLFRIIFDKCVREAVIMLGCFVSKGKVIYTQGEDIKVKVSALFP